jgi:hypothetical protein
MWWINSKYKYKIIILLLSYHLLLLGRTRPESGLARPESGLRKIYGHSTDVLLYYYYLLLF